MSTQSGRVVALVSLAIVIPAALILSGACQLPGSKAPVSADELEQLDTWLARADLARELVRLGCEAFPEPGDREACRQGLQTADSTLRIARGIVTTAKACQTAGDEACLAEQLRQAREILPDVQRLAESLRGGGAGAGGGGPAGGGVRSVGGASPLASEVPPASSKSATTSTAPSSSGSASP